MDYIGTWLIIFWTELASTELTYPSKPIHPSANKRVKMVAKQCTGPSQLSMEKGMIVAMWVDCHARSWILCAMKYLDTKKVIYNILCVWNVSISNCSRVYISQRYACLVHISPPNYLCSSILFGQLLVPMLCTSYPGVLPEGALMGHITAICLFDDISPPSMLFISMANFACVYVMHSRMQRTMMTVRKSLKILKRYYAFRSHPTLGPCASPAGGGRWRYTVWSWRRGS